MLRSIGSLLRQAPPRLPARPAKAVESTDFATTPVVAPGLPDFITDIQFSQGKVDRPSSDRIPGLPSAHHLCACRVAAPGPPSATGRHPRRICVIGALPLAPC